MRQKGVRSVIWFLLFDGSSPDGRGYPDYIGRTTNRKEAHKHYRLCKDNPYSTGCVKVATDTEYRLARKEDFA